MSELGHVTFERYGTRHRAALHANGTWSIDPPLELGWPIEQQLEFISADYGGPSDGPFGPRQLAEAAEFLGGETTIHPSEPMPPGTIY